VTNPYVLLGLLLFWLASVAVAGWAGWDYRDGKVAKEKLDAVTEAIEEHNANSEIDMQAAYEWGESKAKVRTIYANVRNEVASVVAAAPAPASCSLDPDRLRLLNLAIATANAGKGAASGLPDTSPKADPAIKPVR